MKDRKSIFFSSDWHIGHAKVIEYDRRPFTNLEHMHRVLINNFNSTVSSESVTYFLGDMGLCSSEVLGPIVGQLNGTKILILGNHDKGSNAMYKLGFDVVMHGASLIIAGQRVTMSHCPLLGVWRENVEGMKGAEPNENWHGEGKNKRFSIENSNQFHLHGHIHSPNGGKSQRILNKQFDVGVAANGFKPVSISEIESWISKYGR